jgi:hypothetical protein
MKTHILLIFSLLALASCKSCDEAPEALDANAQRVSSVLTLIESGSQLSTFEYDEQGRILQSRDEPSTASSPFPSIDTTIREYTYEIGSVFQKTILKPSNLEPLEVVFLINGQGLMINPGTELEYNSDKQILLERSAGIFSRRYTYENGNLVSRLDSTNTAAGWLVNTYTWKYNLDYLNTIDNQHFGQGFRGWGSKNLVTASFVNGSFITVYSYEFDEKGRVTKRREDNGGPNDWQEKRYEYVD